MQNKLCYEQMWLKNRIKNQIQFKQKKYETVNWDERIS